MSCGTLRRLCRDEATFAGLAKVMWRAIRPANEYQKPPVLSLSSSGDDAAAGGSVAGVVGLSWHDVCRSMVSTWPTQLRMDEPWQRIRQQTAPSSHSFTWISERGASNSAAVSPKVLGFQFNDGTIGGDRCVTSDLPFPWITPAKNDGEPLKEWDRWKKFGSVPAGRPFSALILDHSAAAAGVPLTVINTPGWACFGPQPEQPWPARFHTGHVAYYEVTVLPYLEGQQDPTLPDWEPCLAVGLGYECFNRGKKQPGWSSSSWGYHSDDGRIYHSGGTSGLDYGPRFGVGDTVGVCLVYPPLSGALAQDCLRRSFELQLGFSGMDFLQPGVSGVEIDALLGAIPQMGAIMYTLNGEALGGAHFLVPVWAPLYPVIGVDTRAPIAVNFGSRPFKFDVVKWEKDLEAEAATLPLANLAAPSCGRAEEKLIKQILAGQQRAWEELGGFQGSGLCPSMQPNCLQRAGALEYTTLVQCLLEPATWRRPGGINPFPDLPDEVVNEIPASYATDRTAGEDSEEDDWSYTADEFDEFGDGTDYDLTDGGTDSDLPHLGGRYGDSDDEDMDEADNDLDDAEGCGDDEAELSGDGDSEDSGDL